jgi:hypothetical protein
MTELVCMPIDLACFLRATELAHAIEPGFLRADVTDIEAAWQIDDLDHTSCGWVVALTGGRRVYLTYTMEDAEAGRPEEVALESVAEGQALHELEPGIEWYKPDHMLRHLGLN